ncbi:F-box/LRR-repeat protein 7 isoform X2 [Manduca sexta]|uniref:F-box domain-containing protein n=2 Tax=Manduca sexta TaxID=7130 RepID=A0A921YMG8_MANSE|nr:F-box/LRR-repeat protein 7 isoform X2 [Manduca sexta]XP_030026333.1 F-box/LRR-repeat protein 7 isoform X2 [Manduca sexta]XP_037296833.1 F-box/LRR-repeat protein 7 isoform X2 [Manduca sexta]KAG6441347.1 hypothetical protein O3G_MSEX001745 [Manduca sexta]
MDDLTNGNDETDSLIDSEIDILPEEIMLEIFKLLPVEAIVECEGVCQKWRRLARDTGLWRHIQIVCSGKTGMTEACEANMEIIKTHSECVRLLKLQYIYNYSIINSVINICPNLISLELVMCRIGQEFGTDIIKWPKLKKLNLKNSLLLNSKKLDIQFDQFKYLNYLALSDFGLSPNNCDTLLHCKYLTHILIEKIRELPLEYTKALILSKQDILIAFHIFGCDSIDDHCLFLLSQCPCLKDLAIIRCDLLTDKGLSYLKYLKNIQHLQIWNNIVFSEINLLKTLSSPNLMKLQSLSLSRIGYISPIIVDVISEYYTNLKFLAVYQCPILIYTDYVSQLKSKFKDIVLLY